MSQLRASSQHSNRHSSDLLSSYLKEECGNNCRKQGAYARMLLLSLFEDNSVSDVSFALSSGWIVK